MTLELKNISSVLPSDELAGVFARTRDLWDELRGERIFLTGGTGFFGKWLVETFAFANSELDLGAELVVLTRNPQRFLDQMPHLADCGSIRFQQGDVRTFDAPLGKFACIIHAATDACAKLNEIAPRAMFDVIVEGTRRVLDFSERCGAERLLLVSSGAVYGKQPSTGTHLREDYFGAPDPLSRQAAYGEGKRVAEMLCAQANYHRGINISIARCFAFVGPFLPLDRHFAIGNFLRNALRGETIVMRSAGQDFRSYMYTADLAVWLWTLLFRGTSCRAYNVGSDVAISIREVATAVAQLGNCPVEFGQIVGTSAPIPEYYVPSLERARDELGLDLEVDFRSAIARTFQWHRKRCTFGNIA